MSHFRTPFILLDFNLLFWIPDIDLNKYHIKEPRPDKFNRANEQLAFDELYRMMTRKEIRMGMPNIFPAIIVKNLRKYPELKVKVESFFHKGDC